jgi:cytochrome P450
VALDPTGADVHAEAARVRAAGPMARIVLPGGMPAWSAAGYRTARTVLADHRFSKDPRKHWPAFTRGEVPADFPLMGWVAMENMSTAYGGDHTRLRRLVSQGFTARRVETLRETVLETVGALLDKLAETAPGAVVDIKAEYAHPLASTTIGDLLGVPAGRRDELFGGSKAVVATTTPEEAVAAMERARAGMRDLIAAKRREPGDDLVSALIAARDEDGSRLSEPEMVSTLLLLLGTGTEPVVNLIANTVVALLAHPDQLALVRSGQARWEDAVEETLRADAPVAHLPFRFATEDVEVSGVTVPAGEPVLIGYAAAGRDPEVHGGDADRFDVSRADKSHLAFGHGAHHCMGMPLARLQVAAAVPALFERFPGLGAAVPPDGFASQGSFIMNGRAEVPVMLAGGPEADR